VTCAGDGREPLGLLLLLLLLLAQGVTNNGCIFSSGHLHQLIMLSTLR